MPSGSGHIREREALEVLTAVELRIVEAPRADPAVEVRHKEPAGADMENAEVGSPAAGMATAVAEGNGLAAGQIGQAEVLAEARNLVRKLAVAVGLLVARTLVRNSSEEVAGDAAADTAAVAEEDMVVAAGCSLNKLSQAQLNLRQRQSRKREYVPPPP